MKNLANKFVEMSLAGKAVIVLALGVLIIASYFVAQFFEYNVEQPWVNCTFAVAEALVLVAAVMLFCAINNGSGRPDFLALIGFALTTALMAWMVGNLATYVCGFFAIAFPAWAWFLCFSVPIVLTLALIIAVGRSIVMWFCDKSSEIKANILLMYGFGGFFLMLLLFVCGLPTEIMLSQLVLGQFIATLAIGCYMYCFQVRTSKEKEAKWMIRGAFGVVALMSTEAIVSWFVEIFGGTWYPITSWYAWPCVASFFIGLVMLVRNEVKQKSPKR